MCNKTLTCYKKKIHIKRFFLPLVLVWALIFDEHIQDYIYLPFVISFGCIFLFWNFPILVYFTNSKPIYYEDMWIINHNINKNNVVPQKIRDRINCIFLWILILTNSVLLGALADYWLFKTQDKSRLPELIGITGGILKIFQIINDSSAKILIMLMRRYIKKKADTFHIMDISPNIKDMSPCIRIIEIKKTTTLNKSEIEMSQIKNTTKKKTELNEVI